MEIINYRKLDLQGAIFRDSTKIWCCTATKSSKYFKTIQSAINWITRQGYKQISK